LGELDDLTAQTLRVVGAMRNYCAILAVRKALRGYVENVSQTAVPIETQLADGCGVGNSTLRSTK